jgi:hypothetical protein
MQEVQSLGPWRPIKYTYGFGVLFYRKSVIAAAESPVASGLQEGGLFVCLHSIPNGCCILAFN